MRSDFRRCAFVCTAMTAHERRPLCLYGEANGDRRTGLYQWRDILDGGVPFVPLL
jgi:hypothetical protein